MPDPEKKPVEFKELCSYCGKEVVVPAGFMPNDVEEVKSEKYDEATGSFLVVKVIAFLACNLCHHDMFAAKRTRKARR